MTSSFPLADGGELALVRAGSGEVTVVLLHSYAQDRRVWHKVVSLLDEAGGVGVLAYDHRGHGESTPATAETATLERLGDDLAEVLERAVPVGPVVLVGHGMGGLVAMRMIARHRRLAERRVGAVMFLSTSVGWTAETLPRPLGRIVQDLHAILGPRLVGQVHRKVDKATTVGLRWLLLGDDPSAEDVRLVAEMVARHWPEAVAVVRGACGANLRHSRGACGANLRHSRPTLDRDDRAVALEVAAGLPLVAMVGEKDRLVPVGHAARLVDAVRHGHAITVPGAGHMLPLEAAPEIVPRILAEVREVLTR